MIEYKPNRTFTKDNYNLNYAIKGTGEKNIVLLHGFGLSTYTWRFIENKFNLDKYRLILIDLKGSGFSDKPKNGDYTIRSQADIVTSLLHHLDIEVFNLIAHSYGGIVGLYLLYLKNGSNIPQAILIDAPGFADSTPFFIKALRNPFLSFIGLKLLPSRFLARKIIKQTFYNDKESIKRLLDQYSLFYSLKNNDRAMVQLAEQIVPDNLDKVIKNYKNIESDILIVWGKEDELIKINNGIELSSRFKNCQMAIIPECGHVPQEEKPDELYLLIEKFLK